MQNLWERAKHGEGHVEDKLACAIVHLVESHERGTCLEALKFASSLSAEFWGVCGLLLAPQRFDEDIQFLFNRPFSYSQAIFVFISVQLQLMSRLFEVCCIKTLRTTAIELAHPQRWTACNSRWIDVWLTAALTCTQHSFNELWTCLPHQMHGHAGVVPFLLHNNQPEVFSTLYLTSRSVDIVVEFLCNRMQCWDLNNLPFLETLMHSKCVTSDNILQLVLHIQYSGAQPLLQLNKSYRNLLWSQTPAIIQHLFKHPDSETELLRSSLPYVVRGINFRLFDLVDGDGQAACNMFLYKDEEMLYNACWIFRLVNAASQIKLVRMAITQNKSVLLQHFLPSLPATFPLMHLVFDLADSVHTTLRLSNMFNYSTDLSPLSKIMDRFSSGVMCQACEHNQCSIILANLLLYREFQSTLLYFHGAERFNAAAWSSLKCCTVCQTLHVAAIRGERKVVLWLLENPVARINMVKQRARISLSELYVQQMGR